MFKYLFLFFTLIPSFGIEACCCKSVNADRPAPIHPETGFSPLAAPASVAAAPSGLPFSPTGAAVRHTKHLAETGVISFPQAIAASSRLNDARFGAPRGPLAIAVYTNTDLRSIGLRRNELLFKSNPTAADREELDSLDRRESIIRKSIDRANR